jgi:hypothetical protein
MKQTHFRVSVDPIFRDLDGKPYTTSNPDRNSHRLAASIRREFEAAIDAVTNCQPSNLPAQLDRLRAVRTLCDSSMPLLPESQTVRSPRQLGHPLTVEDFREACLHVLGHYRPPVWMSPGRTQLEEISAKLDAVAALVCKVNGAAEAFEAIRGGSR